MFPAFPVQRAINSGIPYSIIGQTQSHILLLNVAHISHLVGGLDHFLFFHTLGMSSAQLTIFFFRGAQTTNQPLCTHSIPNISPTMLGVIPFLRTSQRSAKPEPKRWKIGPNLQVIGCFGTMLQIMNEYYIIIYYVKNIIIRMYIYIY